MACCSYLVVHTYTGDKKYSGTNDSVHIKLYNNEGKSSKAIVLNHVFFDNFERGNTDSFELDVGDLENFDRSVVIDNLELWKDKTLGLISDDWYLDKVVVENRSTNESYIFPILRWIKCGQHYRIKHLDTSLPQNDPYKDQRTKELEEKKKTYKYHQRVPNGPAQVKSMPPDEEFSFSKKWDLSLKVKELKAKSALVSLFTDPWETIDDTKINHENRFFDKPRCVDDWNTDLHFARQRLAGCNPRLIKVVKSLPQNFPVTDKLLEPLLEGLTIDTAIGLKKLYMTDLHILEGVPVREGFTLCAPLALFFVNSKQQLVPVAIQLFQQPCENNPIFTPNDPPMLWTFVKMWYNNADAQHLQAISHLGWNHLLCEGFVIATHRNLSPTHPIFKLLAPHFLHIIAINWKATDVLLSDGSWTDHVMTMGVKATKTILVKGFDTWRLGIDGLVPEDMKARGVDDPSLLPGYYYADDALLLFQAIKKYINAYVNIYYTSPKILQEDTEIQAWAHELVKERNGEDGGCGMKEVPGNGKLTSIDDLVKILSSCIFTCTVMHSAVSSPQYHEFGFPANYPTMLKGKPPSSKEEILEKTVVASLPDRDEAFKIMVMNKIFSDRNGQSLGDFEVEYVFDPKALNVLGVFREDLEKISKLIRDRNSVMETPYDYLDPVNIENSLST